jgi:preprotein translocase subunit SecB
MSEEERSIRISSLFLLESHFRREPNIEIEKLPPASVLIDTKGGINPEGNKALLELTIKTSNDKNNKIPFEAEVKMVGVFELNNVPQEAQDSFLKINAPAIIFPFIREHFATLTMKSGLPPVLINPVNFVQLATQADKKTKRK